METIIVLLVAALVILSFVLVALGISGVVLWRMAQRKSPISTGFESESLELLRRLDERVKPLPKPTIEPGEAEATITNIIREGRFVAEQMAWNNQQAGHKTSGAEKQREAMRYVRKRLELLGLELDFASISSRLEAEVAASRDADSRAKVPA